MSRDYHASEAPIDFLAVGGRIMNTVLGSFSTREKADIWVESANEWYGPEHPLTPLRVEEVRRDTKPFPAEASRRLRAAQTREEEDAAMTAMFATLVDDEEEEALEEAIFTGSPDDPGNERLKDALDRRATAQAGSLDPIRPKIGGRKK